MENTRNSQRILQYFRQHRVTSIVTGQVIVAVMLGVVLFGGAFSATILGAFAQSPCSAGDLAYSVVSGDTLGAIASRYGTSWQRLASYNRIGNPNVIYINQHVCIPGKGKSNGGGTVSSGPAPIRGVGNFFAIPQCTWWVAQRYYQLTGIYVPWTTNANAWQWTARAYEYRWRVSNRPTVGAIIDLQPGVQGAYGYGHVGVVERVLGNGDVIASNMNWGGYPYSVTNVRFTPGYGVTFISA